ncbi:DUF397 domain-containing protein [Actinoallomurus vinaceus]
MTTRWRRSSRSGQSGDNCVELAVIERGRMGSHTGK